MEKKESAVAQGQKEILEDYLPIFVFVTSMEPNGPTPARSIDEIENAAIVFLDKNKRPLTVNEHSDPVYDLDPLNIPLLKVHLNDIMPEPFSLHGKSGWIVPLGEPGMGNMDVNELVRIRNIMFWESLLNMNQVGLLAYSMLVHRKMLINIDEGKAKIEKMLADGDYLMGEPVPENIFDVIKALMKVIDGYRGKSSEGVNTKIMKEEIMRMMCALEERNKEQAMELTRLVELLHKKQHDSMVMQKELQSFVENTLSTAK